MRRRSTTKDDTWQTRANCRGVDPDLFYPERGEPTGPAKAVCAGCVVRDACLAYALTTPIETEGIWGGLSENERRRLRSLRHRDRLAARQQGSAA